MRALAGNPALANASGLHTARIILMVTFASGAIAGLGGGLLSLSTGATSTWGTICSCRCSLRPSSAALATLWVRSPEPC